MSIETRSAQNLASSSPSGGVHNVLGALGLANLFTGKNKGGGGGGGKTAADWQNELTMEQYKHGMGIERDIVTHSLGETAADAAHKREQRGKAAEHRRGEKAKSAQFERDKANFGMLQEGAGRGYRLSGGAIGKDGIKFNYAPTKGRSGRAPAEGPTPASTVAQGQQFNKPMPAYSILGEGGKRAPNPEYQKWNAERTAFNTQRTAGNVAPVGLPKKPGQTPKAPKAS